MLLGGSDLVLRPWAHGDERDLVTFGNDHAVWRNLTNRFPHPYTFEHARAWLTRANERPDHQRHFAIVVSGRAVGGAGFLRQSDLQTRVADVGYWVGRPYWGRGLATQALTMVSALAFQSYDFVRLQATVIAWNPASCRVAEKAGYSFEARMRNAVWKDQQLSDLLVYVRLRP